MERFVIEGGRRLRGTITPAGNKNAALPLLAASLLTDQPVVLRNIPQIGDVATKIALLRGLGMRIEQRGGHSWALHASGVGDTEPDAALARQIRTSILLAADTDCDSLAILTGVEKVAVDFNKPTQRDIDEMTVEQARAWLAEGQFPAGSMGPKIAAAIDFATSGPGRKCLITSLDKLVEGLQGKTGTWVVG